MANIAITGAARGIGFELAKQHTQAGDRVFALVRKPSAALTALAEAFGGTLTVHTMDVSSDASVKAGSAETGGEPIDILYNVAGIVGPIPPELESSDWDAWDEVINIMVKGPLRVLQAFLPRLHAGSKVINLTSQLAASTWPYGGLYAYGAAKAGLNRMMRSVAIDLKARGIVVGLVHPGYVRTEMSGPSAEISPEESAASIRTLTAGWTIEETGEFYKWNGEKHAW
ncbi:SDR family NAD(P)-dependent oxidoreductase [Novosphingobium sp. Chol11]|uniref:SDR family NAD(P)-dependent oxidoreductase n=1 Tax=Novosphingobium sp. Chol11 TaxID=1385763 RepID=UPI0025CE3F7F|nr:SDR family NAD(P)-dependent oxidoreductase [Novosphingobium sp. Chol11]